MAKDRGRDRGSGNRGRDGRENSGRDTKPKVPANWPPQIAYLTTPVYVGITARQRQMLQEQGGGGQKTPLSEIPPILRFGPSPLVEIRIISDPAHPACGQRGLFAARPLAAGSFVLPYLGVYHRGSSRPAPGHAESDYDLWLDRAADVAVDAARAGNEARFVNDYRGTGRGRPNAEFREVWDPRRGERGMAVYVLPAGKRALVAGGGGGIAKGDEILVSYGKGFWEMRQKEGEKEKDNGVQQSQPDQEKLQESQGKEKQQDTAQPAPPPSIGHITYALAAASISKS